MLPVQGLGCVRLSWVGVGVRRHKAASQLMYAAASSVTPDQPRRATAQCNAMTTLVGPDEHAPRMFTPSTARPSWQQSLLGCRYAPGL